MKANISIFLWLIVLVANAQVQRCGYPSYAPKKGEGYLVVDTCSRLSYLWDTQDKTWYNQNNIIDESAPQIVLFSASIKISNAKISWYKPSSNYWYDVIDGAWRNRASIAVDSILATNNRWTGKNTFADSLTAEKGIKSNSLIDTKGMKSSGSATKAATEANGVQKDAVIELTSSTSLDGTFNTIICNPTSADIVLTLPSATADNAGWKYIISKKQASNYNVRVTASGFNHVIISPSVPRVVKQRNGVWGLE